MGVGPVPTAAGPGGVLVRSNSLFLSRASSSSVRAGAWTFITWLEAPAQQARGVLPSDAAFFPHRRSAAADPVVVDAFAKQPLLRATWDVLANAKWAPIPALGAHAQVMAALGEVLKTVSTGETGLDDALAQAAHTVDTELAAYNTDPLRYARCELQPSDANGSPPRCR